MSPLRDRLARLFLEPEAAAPAPPDAEPRWLPPAPGATSPPPPPAVAPRRVGLVCGPRELRVAGGAAALALLQRGPARAAVVLEWSGAPGAPAQDRPAGPAARRVAAGLRADGLEAWASGRVVRAALPEPGAQAAAVAREALRTLEVPVVLAVAAARDLAVDEVLAEQERILMVHRADADPELTALAVAGLAAHGRPVEPVELASSPGAAALARSGHALASPLRAGFSAALGEP